MDTNPDVILGRHRKSLVVKVVVVFISNAELPILFLAVALSHVNLQNNNPVPAT